MASVQDIRRRLRAVRNTRKITRAMEMVAAARLRKSEERIRQMRPYADRMMELMVGTARASTSLRGLPLLQRHEQEQTVAVVPITGDRALAGGFNAQVLRRAFAFERELRGEGKQVRWVVSGKKGNSSLRFRGYTVEQAYVGFSERPAYSDAQALAHKLSELYVENEVDRVVLVYNHYVSPLVQQVTVQDVLPIPEEALAQGDEEQEEAAQRGDFIYEPEPEEILARLLPVYVETELYRALLESAASEQGARMSAMRNATKSAGELIDNLTLAMNRARQAEITQEILEVVAGADALSG
ncbi:MAG TPA: ATP synthase F1 subunit gamma [Gaiellaceae bacterium]